MTNVVAIIPARVGSKSIPKKNLHLLGGKPLLHYPVISAKKSKYINKILVSTDDNEIKEEALRAGAEVMQRPEHLSHDTALVIDTIRYTVKELDKAGYRSEIILLLECTSPFRLVEDVDKAIEILKEGQADSVTTFTESCISPGRIWKIQGEEATPFLDGANPFLPRQKQPVGYQLTGQIYAFTRTALDRHPVSTSLLLGKLYPIITDKKQFVDIDDELDFIFAEQVLKKYFHEDFK